MKHILAVLALGCFPSFGAESPQWPVDWVDPSIGSVGHLLEPTKPTVHLPNSMLRVYPVRRDGLDDQITCFPLTIISHRLGELFSIMPCAQAPAGKARFEPAAYDQEKLSPYYYSSRLDDSLIQIEFSPTERCGYFRFRFPSGKPVLLAGNHQGGELKVAGNNALEGVEHFNDMSAFLYGEFSSPVRPISLKSVSGKTPMVLAAEPNTTVLEFRYGISFISIEQAKKNLLAEVGVEGFEAVKQRARDRWNATLSRIKVEGGTPAQRRVFYTAIYRCCERMVNISEGNQYYSAFDHRVHQDSRPFYVDNWLWDTHRALEPLHTLLFPEMQADKIQSYVRMYEQGGWMPSFAVLWGDYPCMTGNHAAAWVADAWFKGIHDFDVQTAYEGIRKNSLEATLLPWRNGPKCSLDDFYNEHGYLPALHPEEKETVSLVHPTERRQAISVTLEQSYDDWCTAQLARAIARENDYKLFLQRAGNYRNLYRAEKGFMWPKDAQGHWVDEFDPRFSGGQGGRDYTTENNGYTYVWDVQHDFAGLAALLGGNRMAEAKLDQLFRTDLGRSKYEFFATFPDSTGMVGQFAMGNEPSMATPYVYNHLGAAWKTQKRVRQLLEHWFTDTPMGIPGDEDGGGMSAFVVFSMLGFYPVVPGVPVYEFGSPVFDSAAVQLPNGNQLSIVCKNNSRDNKYISEVKLNGIPQDQIWFRHADAVRGLNIELTMTNTPNQALGDSPERLPPSAMRLNPADFAQPATPVTGQMPKRPSAGRRTGG